MTSVRRYIEDELGLTINEKKSKVCGATTANFLGFHLQNIRGKLGADQVPQVKEDSKRN